FRRQATSFQLISQALCFCLLLQGSGIAHALPLPPKRTFISQSELETARLGGAVPGSESGSVGHSVDRAWTTAVEIGVELGRWLEDRWSEPAVHDETPLRVAQASGVLPLPPRLMSAFLASSSRGQTAPPNPPDLGSGEVEDTTPAELASLRSKSATEQIPLLAGLNLISIPEEPTGTDPAAASDLTVVDHKIGMWVSMTAAAALPSDGNLPATTTIELCEGWNLIGLPAAEPRHPYAALSSIAGKWQRIFGYDALDPDDPWEVFSIDVPAWANDLEMMKPGRGYWVLANEAVTLEIRNQGPPPTVAIAAPADLAVVTEPTEILGTVDSDRLASWTLTSRPIGDGEAITLAAGNAPVAGGTLATFDPTLLLNGLYELELTATDVQGQQVSESIAVSVEGQMKIGHFTLSFVDLAIPVSGLDIQIIRTYDSRDKQPRDFGVGWRLDIRQGSYRNNRPPGDGWQFQTGFVACDTALESKSHLTVVRLSDQEVYRFALRLVRGVPRDGGGCSATAEFEYVDGPLPGTTLEILGNNQVFQETPSGNRVLDLDTFATYEPGQVRLTTRDGRIFELDLGDEVTKVEDLNGNQLSITPAGITHSNGRGILFERDAEGPITRITDPLDRVISYGYDAAGDLVSFTDRAGAVTRFTYDGDHRLLDIEDPRGVKPIRNEYDADGRVVRHIDAFGKVIELGHDQDSRREVVTDRLGHSRVMEYDVRGNVVRETDELGNVTTRLFDIRDNQLSETDPLDQTTTFTYTNANDLASMVDPLGNVTSFTYNSRGQLLTVTDPRGGVTTNVYNAQGNLTQITDALGSTTFLTYDTAGNPLTTTDALGQITTFQYDAFGNRTKETDALGSETHSTYDAAGNLLTETRTRTLPDESSETLLTSFLYDDLDRPTTVIAADGTISSVTYDLLGKTTSRTDMLGRVTTMTYDLMGQLVSTSYPDGTSESQSHDGEGRLVAQVDRGGRTSTFLYDPAGRRLTTIHADGSSTASTYDAASQLVAATDARGNTTSFTYDAAGRRTQIINALGNGPTFTYDKAGNLTSITNAKGRTTTSTYDSLGRLLTTKYPDNTTSQLAYDALGQLVARTDQAGLATELSYDAAGSLTSVKDSLEQTTSYGYDQVGNRRTVTDANGHTTSFEYDRLGRQIARTLPDGSRDSVVYNADGTVAGHTDFNGTNRSFEYDLAGRPTRRAYPDGSEAILTYTPTGQRATATDYRGTTSYSYDNADRLTEKTDPGGFKLSYTYDAQGNRISLTATVGAQVYTTAYAYDAVDRLVAVTDNKGGVAAIEYDANGNRASLAFPNGVNTTYSYDDLDRLYELRSETSIGDVLQSYRYTLDAAGNRLRIDEHDGTSRHYLYDGLYRLIQDRVTNAADALVYQTDYSYDPVGNRLMQVTEEGTGTTTIASTYDDRDRLLSTGTKAYGWDANGNLISKVDDGNTTYAWDSEDRLISASFDGGAAIETNYDLDGNRVRMVVTPSSGPVTSTDYLVDTNGPLSHVVAEVVDGSITALYTRAGDQLIGLEGPSRNIQRYYHADGLGSARALSDELGAPAELYAYTAFGELLEPGGADPQPYRFAGESYDHHTAFYFNRARWLEPETGRFASKDPWQGAAFNVFSLHSYIYANINPVNNKDPSGLITLQQTTFAQGVMNNVFTSANSIVRTVGKQARGKLLNAIGKKWEQIAINWLGIFLPNATIIFGPRAVRVGKHFLDALIKVKDSAGSLRQVFVEIKFAFPGKAVSFSRLVGQVRSGVQAARASKNGQMVVWSFRSFTNKQIQKVLGEAAVTEFDVVFVSGLVGTARWLEQFLGFRILF
ncbi:MAG: RHS repeat-associated core domain-containing protein, partial [bacterium]|nr:RHS repeat-associated core domain-containing protein [bacterium]